MDQKWYGRALIGILAVQFVLSIALLSRLSTLEKTVSRLHSPNVISQFDSVIDGRVEDFESLIGGPSLGPDDAPITIVEFSDFHCPACRSSQPVLSQILKKNPQNFKRVYRFFPLTPEGTGAFLAATAAECAKAQQAFWPMHEVLFASDESLTTENLLDLAGNLSLDTNTFSECIISEDTKQTVHDDISLGRSFGVTSTPTFFINGYRIVGSYSEAMMEGLFRELSKNKGKRNNVNSATKRKVRTTDSKKDWAISNPT